MINLLVTGMLRSGTTLLDKALNAHPDIKIAYQPFPQLFIHAKKKFYQSVGHAPPYHVLSHYCPDSVCTPEDFTSWLNKVPLPHSIMAENVPSDKIHLLNSSSSQKRAFANWYTYLIRQMYAHTNMPCLGSKEVLIEEFVPHLIHNNIYCVLIIRDPRDVITSLDFGQGKKFTGDYRPTLFNLRNWRKSVYFALALSESRNFCMIRFEDLVLQPVDTLNKIAGMIGLRPFDEKWWINGFRDEHGALWRGNSSFGQIKPFHPASIGGHTTKLSQATRLYIESTCRREMLALGYAVSPLSTAECKKSISGFKDPFIIKRPEFEQDYSNSMENVNYEIRRLENPEPRFFLFPNIAEKMMRIHLW